MEPTHMFNGDALTTYMRGAPPVYWNGAAVDTMFARTALDTGVVWTPDRLEATKQAHIRELNDFYAKAKHV